MREVRSTSDGRTSDSPDFGLRNDFSFRAIRLRLAPAPVLTGSAVATGSSVSSTDSAP